MRIAAHGIEAPSGESSHAKFLHVLRRQIFRIQPCRGILARVAKALLHVELKSSYVQGTLCSKMPTTCKRSSARASSRCDRAKDLGRRRRRRLVLNPSLRALHFRCLRTWPRCDPKIRVALETRDSFRKLVPSVKKRNQTLEPIY